MKSLRYKKFRLPIGSSVRVPVLKDRFKKGYMQTFTDEIYKVIGHNDSGRRPVYILENTKKKRVPGTWYDNELVKVNDESLYRVKILGTRIRKRQKEYHVEYINFPGEQEWINAARLQPLK